MIPNVRVEVAFTSGFATPAASRVWTDITQWVEGSEPIGIDYGRSPEQSDTPPGQMQLTLNNKDGRFTPGLASSPYYPNVKLLRPIRVTAIAGGVESVRFTGYVAEWPVVWPTGGEETAAVTLTAVSRRARLGQTAPLPSAIRAAYLATNPIRYWPMDEDLDQRAINNQQIYRNVVPPFTNNKVLGAFAKPGYELVQGDGLPGPTDEAGLLKFPAYTSISALGAGVHSVGASNVFAVGSNITVECVARVGAKNDTLSLVNLMKLSTSDSANGMYMNVSCDGLPEASDVSAEMQYRDPNTLALLDDQVSNPASVTYHPAAFAIATDGEIHHYAMTLTGGNVGRFYLDGVLLYSLTLTPPYNFSRRFTSLTIGPETFKADAWIGHVAVHDRPLTASEILVRAGAATAASESVQERVTRLAGYADVPAVEVKVDPTSVPPLGPQGELGRTASEVIDEVATSTGGVVYDDRAGNLTLAARTRRYNTPSSFNLSAKAQEVGADLSPQMDDQYLVNMVEVTRSDAQPIILTDDQSIADYGVYSQSLAMVSTSPTEAEAAGQAMLDRGGQPRPRVTKVTVDVSNVDSGTSVLYGTGVYGAGIYPEATLQTKLMSADIGTRFSLIELPAQAPSVTLPLFIEGYHEEISVEGHTLTFNTTPADNVAGWVLDDPFLSLLGSSTVVVY